MRAPLVVALASAALPAGFAVAEWTGTRALGGAVMAALVLAALAVARPRPALGVLWVALVLAAFAVSHALAGTLGAWGAVAVVSLAAGLGAVRLLAYAE